VGGRSKVNGLCLEDAMQIQLFFEHHGLRENPFTQEDAKEDLVFLRDCIDHAFHPLWGRIHGNPEEPSAAVLLGERGSGKTALRYQIVEHLKRFNAAHPDRRVLVLAYDDFNPFLDEFRARGGELAAWGLNDHMDAILSLATTRLVDLVLNEDQAPGPSARERVPGLGTPARRDLLMLAVAYDRSGRSGRTERCRRLAQALRYPGLMRRLSCKKETAQGVLLTVALGLAWWFLGLPDVAGWLLLAGVGVAWLPFLRRRLWARALANRIRQGVRVVRQDTAELRRLLLRFPKQDLEGEPLGCLDDADARYRLLTKLIEVGDQLGFGGVVVVVDRVDEPHPVKGDAEKMFQLMRAIFDLKFLKHARLGVKLLLPAELYRPMQQQLNESVARLDKMNFIRSLEWTGPSLYDLINARLRACSAAEGQRPSLRGLLDEAVGDAEVIGCLERLAIPRLAFKLMHGLIAKHCLSHTDDRPVWKVSRDTFVECRTEFLRNAQDFERGLALA
jgi:hypothetical protein